MRTAGRLLATFVATVVIGGIAIGVCLAALVPGTVEIATAHRYTVKQVKELSGLAETTTVFWGDDGPCRLDPSPNTCQKMGTLGLLDRETVPLTEVPVLIQNVVIATEDRTFWTNDGIDLGAVFRVFLTNVVSGEIDQGGSTITQQLVKNRIVGAKRDVNRKIRELEDALRLNEKFSKDKILEEYLNTVYFGQGSYGIRAAARRFFVTADPFTGAIRGKTMAELTIGEAALLAGVISSPEGNNPFFYPDRATRRRADVLRGMVDLQYITQEQADAANNEPLPTVKPPAEQRPDNFLMAEVQDRLLDLSDARYNEALGTTLAERESKLLKGGLKVYTTFDQRLQGIAVDVTANAAAVQAKGGVGSGWESSLVSIEPATGNVRAMVGGTDFASEQYNIATHPIGRQPGSTWKVITLASALANGYSPNDLVDGTEPCPNFNLYPFVTDPNTFPNNSADGNENGQHTIAVSTSQSINCAFVRLSTSVGMSRVVDTAHALGITQDTIGTKPLNLSIGTIEATPLEMATVMATIANMGVKQAPIVVTKIVNRDGITILDDTVRAGETVLAADVAACTQNVLRGVITGGTGTAAAVAGHTAYGKTGTTDRTADAWFIGATPQLATAVWFGFRAQPITGAGFGGASSAPIFSEFMSRALEGTPDLGLPAPGPVCVRPPQRVNQDGGRIPAPVAAPVVPVTPQQPSVVQVPTPQPTSIPGPATTAAPATSSP